jgi:hypothetical protein
LLIRSRSSDSRGPIPRSVARARFAPEQAADVDDAAGLAAQPHVTIREQVHFQISACADHGRVRLQTEPAPAIHDRLQAAPAGEHNALPVRGVAPAFAFAQVAVQSAECRGQERIHLSPRQAKRRLREQTRATFGAG